ncbi:alpha/beta hydrolase [Pseudonocardiaceae bacterium YIM PH 21723]|nr:alpha/beta hydrolase [Pseudonocardiaceae bacterium YIM PH 21723]
MLSRTLNSALAAATLALAAISPAQAAAADSSAQATTTEAPEQAKAVDSPETHIYGKAGDRELPLRFWPAKDASKPAPLVIYIHGGAWAVGSLDGYPLPMPWGDIQRVIPELRERGYAVASLDYRLSGEAQWPAQIFDVKAGVRYLRANAATLNVDPDRFAAWGDSAGGHLSAMLGTTADRPELEGDEGSPGVSSRVRAVADWFGPTDIGTMSAGGPVNWLMHGHIKAPEAALLGCTPKSCPEKARLASPSNYVSSDDAPFLFQHGRCDHVVPFAQSVKLEAQLRSAGVATEFHAYNTDHEFIGLASQNEILATFYAFLDKQLK